MSIVRSLVAVACVAAFTSWASAFTIGFESSEGYALGALTSQPAGSTTGTWNSNTIMPVVDVAGNRVAQTVAPGASGSGSPTFTPNENTFGAVDGSSDDPTTAGYSGIVAFAFDLTVHTTSESVDSGSNFLSLSVGRSSANVQFYFRKSGRIRLWGASAGDAVDALGNILDIDDYIDQAITISGVIDYTTHTHTLTINGVDQPGTFGLRGDFVNARFQDIILAPLATTDAEYRQLSIDNIYLSNAVVPEPASLSLLGLGALVAVRRRR